MITLEEDCPEIMHDKIKICAAKKSSFLISHLRLYFKTLKEFTRDIDIIHVRSYLPMPIALILKRIFGVKVIFDMRGLLPEEHIYLNNKNTNSLNYKILKYMEKIFVNSADEIIVVSNNFKEYIQNKYVCRDNISVIYCSANDRQADIIEKFSEDDFRIKYNVKSNQITIAYVGSFYKYQQIEEIIKFSSDAIESDDIKFLVFTKDQKEDVMILLERYHISKENVEINYLPTELLTNHLRYCDYGIIMRSDNILNLVASPIKISEYIMNDMKIIHSGCIGDFDKILKEFDCGINIVNNELKLEQLPSNYTNSTELKELVSYDYNSDKYLSIYRKIARKEAY